MRVEGDQKGGPEASASLASP